MKHILLLLLLALPTYAQNGVSRSPVTTPRTVNYYMATTGNDSNPCTTSSKCLTFAHVRKLIPQALDNNYIINVADGTYAEPLILSGIIGDGYLGGSLSSSLKILGNDSTPANVVFTGDTACGATLHTGACVTGTARIILDGITVTPSTSGNPDVTLGIACYAGTVEYKNIRVVVTLASSSRSIGVDNFTCNWSMTGNVTVSGFDTNNAPQGGLGFYNAGGTHGIIIAGTLTITGPGTGSSASADGTNGLVIEKLSLVDMVGAGTAITISGVQTGINLAANSSLVQFAGSGTITLSNGTTTPTGSTGVSGNNEATFDYIGGSVSVDHYTTCLSANSLSEMASDGTTTSLTNCTAKAVSGSAVIIGF